MKLQLTDSIWLRPFRETDRDDLVAGLNNWQVARWLATVPHPYRVDHANAYLARQEHARCDAAVPDAGQILALGICADDRVIGGISLVPAGRIQGAREFGFWLSQSWWGQGIMSAAVQSIVNEVRRHAPDTVFVAAANTDNPRSQRVILSLGFKAGDRHEIFSAPLQRDVPIQRYCLTSGD